MSFDPGTLQFGISLPNGDDKTIMLYEVEALDIESMLTATRGTLVE